jgi:hypothetical protein
MSYVYAVSFDVSLNEVSRIHVASVYGCLVLEMRTEESFEQRSSTNIMSIMAYADAYEMRMLHIILDKMNLSSYPDRLLYVAPFRTKNYTWTESENQCRFLSLIVPFWALAFPLLLPPIKYIIGGVRRYRRRASGNCVECGYHLAAHVRNIEARDTLVTCSECGARQEVDE